MLRILYNKTVNKRRAKRLFIILLLTVTLFGAFKYVSFLKKQRDNLFALANQAREQAATLEKEIEEEKALSQRATQENSELKEYLRASKRRLSRLFSVYEEAQKKVDQLDSTLSLLKQENSSLLEEKGRVFKENEELKAKLLSVAEFRKAMKELRKQVRKVSTQIKHQPETRKAIEGNRGFLIKDGQLVSPAKVTIEVSPVIEKE